MVLPCFTSRISCLESESEGFLCAWSGFQVGESAGEAPEVLEEVGICRDHVESCLYNWTSRIQPGSSVVGGSLVWTRMRQSQWKLRLAATEIPMITSRRTAWKFELQRVLPRQREEGILSCCNSSLLGGPFGMTKIVMLRRLAKRSVCGRRRRPRTVCGREHFEPTPLRACLLGLENDVPLVTPFPAPSSRPTHRRF